MIDISRITHIGQVVAELDPQVERLEKVFGLRRTDRFEDASQRCRGARLEVPGRSGIAWEVLAPADGSSPLQEFLDGPCGPGLHHIAVEVPDPDAARRGLTELGIEARAVGAGEEGCIEASPAPKDGATGLRFRFFPPRRGARCGGAAAGSPARAAESGRGEGLGIVAVDHVCQAYRSRDDLARWYERVFGMREIYRTPDGEHPDLADLVMEIPGRQMRWEIIQPEGEGSFIERFLDTRGAAAHHVTLEVSDFDRALARLEAHEVRTFGGNEGVTDGARWRDAFVHPKQTGGILVQLFWEEKPDVWVRSDKIPSPR